MDKFRRSKNNFHRSLHVDHITMKHVYMTTAALALRKWRNACPGVWPRLIYIIIRYARSLASVIRTCTRWTGRWWKGGVVGEWRVKEEKKKWTRTSNTHLDFGHTADDRFHPRSFYRWFSLWLVPGTVSCFFFLFVRGIVSSKTTRSGDKYQWNVQRNKKERPHVLL